MRARELTGAFWARLGLCVAGALALAASAAPALAQGDPALEGMTGTWEFTNAKSSRSCRVHLGAEAGLHGRQLGAPSACRSALPLLGQAAGWTLDGATFTLVDAAGKRLVALEREASGPGYASSSESLSLKPLGQAKAPAAEPIHTAAGPAATPAPKAGGGVAAPPAPPASVGPHVTLQSLAGLYGVARDKNKPICSIDLMLAQGRKDGRMPAKLSGGCIDSGLKVFDPVSWKTANGRLYLVAKKGHEQGFSVMPDGTWQKDPASGAQLYLKKQ